jgi:hypothetical protein
MLSGTGWKFSCKALFSALLAIGLMAGPASAGMVLLLQDQKVGGTTYIVLDDFDGPNGSATGLGVSNRNDSRTGDGQVGLTTSIGVFNLTVSTGVSKPNADPGELDLNIYVSSTAAGSLRILLTDTDFMSGVGLSQITGHIGGTTQGSVSYRYGVDPGNGEGLFTQAVSPIGPFTAGAFNHDSLLAVNLDDSFSISTEVVVTHGSGFRSTGLDIQTVATILPPETDIIPEPAVISLLGLAGLALVRRKIS